MTTWASTDFTGGAIGTNPSTTTEPIFASRGGTAAQGTYQAVVGAGAGQSLQTIGAFDFVLELGGRTNVRIAFDVQRTSGTQTAGLAAILFRDGTTNRGDAFLRNQNGGQWALRGDNVAATTYSGQSTRAQANGEVYHVEMEWESGVGFTLQIWHPGTTSTDPPSETFLSSMTSPVTNVRLFNPTGTTGLTMRYASFRATDGESVWAEAGSVSWAHNGYVRASSFAVNAKAGAASVGMEVSTSSLFTSPTTFAGVDKANGYWQMTATGLNPNTTYYWRITTNGLPSSVTGSLKTLPLAGNAASFTFGWGSCWYETAPSNVFQSIVARNPAFFAILGDYGYTYITGGPNGNISPTTAASVRAQREPVLQQPGSRTLTAQVGIEYTYSDCDGAGANADGITGGHATGAVQEVYRQLFAHPELPITGCGARSWVVGRIRFIQTDETALASDRTATDNSSKTKLGTAQKAWFKGEIDLARAAGQSVVWLGDGPWIEPTGAGSATYNSWAKYNTERTEIGSYIAASGVRLIRLHGDTHTLFVDNGTNNAWGGFPTASAAPMQETAQAFGYTTSGPKHPTVETNSSRQYGIASISDNGTSISILVKGYSATTSAPTEVERFSESFDLTPLQSVSVRLFAGASPPTVGSDASAVNLGVEFFASEASEAAGIWYFQPTTGTVSTAARTCAIYEITGDDTGILRYSGSHTPSGSGWQRHKILDPILLDPTKRYKAVVFHPAGGYVATPNYFSAGDGSNGVVREYLTAPSAANSFNGDQGSFLYGGALAYPTNQLNSANYWIDVETRQTPFKAAAYAANPAAGQAGQYTASVTVPAGIDIGDWMIMMASWPSGATTTLDKTGWTTVKAETQAQNMWTCILARQYLGGATVNVDINNGVYSPLWVGLAFYDGDLVSGVETLGGHGTRGGVTQTMVTAPALTAAGLPRWAVHLATTRSVAATAVSSITATGVDFFLDSVQKTLDTGTNACVHAFATADIPTTAIPAVTTDFNGSSGNALAMTLVMTPRVAAATGVVTTALVPSFGDSTLQVGAILTQGSALRIVVSTSSLMTSPAYFNGTIATSKWATARATGLTPNTLYYIGFEVDGVFQTDYQLTAYTTGPDVPSFIVLAGSCQQTGSNHASLARAATEGARFVCHMGDLHYADAFDESAWRAGMYASLTSANMKTLMKAAPMDYIWDNHDRIINNDADTDEVNNGTTNALTVTRYRELAGSVAYPHAGAQYRTWRIGRVRFLHTDAWTLRSDPDINPDAGDMFGPTQVQWIKDTLTTSTEPVIVWFCTFPNHNAHNGRWNSFENETAALDAWLAARPGIRKRLIMVGGDSHDIKADSGTRTVGRPEDGSPHHNFIGVPTLNASGFDQGSDTLWDTGNWDIASMTTGLGGASYSRLSFLDTGNSIQVTWEAINGVTGAVRATYIREVGTLEWKTAEGRVSAIIGTKVADARRMVGAELRVKAETVPFGAGAFGEGPFG